MGFVWHKSFDCYSSGMYKNENGFGILEMLIFSVLLGFSSALFTTTGSSLNKKAADTDLKNYTTSLIAQVTEHASNNNGTLPSDLTVIRQVVDAKGDKTYKDWKNAGAITTGNPSASTFYYAVGYNCDEKTSLMVAGNKRDAAIAVLLPSGKADCTAM